LEEFGEGFEMEESIKQRRKVWVKPHRARVGRTTRQVWVKGYYRRK